MKEELLHQSKTFPSLFGYLVANNWKILKFEWDILKCICIDKNIPTLVVIISQ
jgi:hypothetical protein